MSDALARWKRRVARLKHETLALSLAYRDPRVPWYAKLFAAGVIAYAFSPLDLIPDFVPVLGYLDDLILVPLGVALALKMIPPEVMAESRIRAQETLSQDRPTNWIAGALVIALWLLLAAIALALVLRIAGR